MDSECLYQQDFETTRTHLVRQQARLLPQDGLHHPVHRQLALIVHLQQQGLELGWTAGAGSGVSAPATELLGVMRVQKMTQQSLEVTVERQLWHANDACVHKLSMVYLQIQMQYCSPTGQSLGSGSAEALICWVQCKQGNSVLASVLTFEKQGSIKLGGIQRRRILHLGLLNGVEVRSRGLALVALCMQPGTTSQKRRHPRSMPMQWDIHACLSRTDLPTILLSHKAADVPDIACATVNCRQHFPHNRQGCCLGQGNCTWGGSSVAGGAVRLPCSGCRAACSMALLPLPPLVPTVICIACGAAGVVSAAAPGGVCSPLGSGGVGTPGVLLLLSLPPPLRPLGVVTCAASAGAEAAAAAAAAAAATAACPGSMDTSSSKASLGAPGVGLPLPLPSAWRKPPFAAGGALVMGVSASFPAAAAAVAAPGVASVLMAGGSCCVAAALLLAAPPSLGRLAGCREHAGGCGGPAPARAASGMDPYSVFKRCAGVPANAAN
jgi:hypothetical protein